MPPKKKLQADPPPDDQDDAIEDDTQYYTAEDTNKAIGARLNAFKKSFMKDIEAMFAPIAAKIGEIQAAPAPKADEGEKGQSKEVNNQLAALQKQLDAEKAARKASDDERAAEKARAMGAKREGMVMEALTKVGINNPTVAKAAALLLMPSVAHADDGRVVFKRQDKFGADEEVDVDAAVGEWAKTDDGKAFIPAKQAKGSGTRPDTRPFAAPARGNNGNDAKNDRAARKEAAREFLRASLAGASGNAE